MVLPSGPSTEFLSKWNAAMKLPRGVSEKRSDWRERGLAGSGESGRHAGGRRSGGNIRYATLPLVWCKGPSQIS